jgi:hypothetical protein
MLQYNTNLISYFKYHMTYGKCGCKICVSVFSTSYVGNIIKVEQEMCVGPHVKWLLNSFILSESLK